jgi:hypothetical protein
VSNDADDALARHDERRKRFAVKPYVIADGRTPEQIERDQRLLLEVRKLAEARRRAVDDADPRDRVIAVAGFTKQREPTQTYEQALKGKAGLDYLPDAACATCSQMPFWNGYTYDDNHDREKHAALSDDVRLDLAIERVNRAQPLSEIAMPRLVRSNDDD